MSRRDVAQGRRSATALLAPNLHRPRPIDSCWRKVANQMFCQKYDTMVFGASKAIIYSKFEKHNIQMIMWGSV